MTRKFWSLTAIAAIAALTAAPAAINPATAAPVAIANAGFQDPNIGNGIFTVGSIRVGMCFFGSAPQALGVFNPTSTQFDGFNGNGEQTAYLNGGLIGQNVGPIVAGMDYKLSFDVGERKDLSFPNSPTVGFFIDAYNGTSFTGSIGRPMQPGIFETQSFSTTAALLAPFVGQNLLIFFAHSSLFGQQINLDNIQLNTSPATATVPLPAALPLLIGALGLLSLVGRRRRSKAGSV